MRHFTLIQTHAPLSDKKRQEFQAKLTDRLPYPGSSARFRGWWAPSRKTTLFCWSNDPFENETDDDLLFQRGEHAVAHAGWIWDPAMHSLQELYAKLSRPDPVDAYLTTLSGVYALCRAREGRATVCNTIAGQPEIFYGSNSHMSIVSTRGLHVASLLSNFDSIQYSPLGVASLVSMEFCYTDATTYADIRRLAPHSKLTLDPSGISVVPLDDEFSNYGENNARATAADFDDLAQCLLNSLDYFKQKPANLSISLTGGKDSRIVLAALHASGLPFEALTVGQKDHADMVTAGMLCETLGVAHHRVTFAEHTGRIAIDVIRPLAEGIWKMDAGHYNRPSHPSPTYDSILHAKEHRFSLCGTGGEVIRGVAAGLDRGIDTKANLAELQEIALNKVRTVMAGNHWLLREPYRSQCHDWTQHWITTNYNPANPTALLERHQLFINQIKRVSSAINLSAERGGEIDLLLDNQFLRKANRLRAIDRTQNHINFEILQRLAPELIDHPLAESRWCFEAKAPRNGDERGYAARTPVSSNKAADEMNYTYMHVGSELRELFREELFGEGQLGRMQDTLLAEIVDMQAFEQIFNSPDILLPRFYNLAWNILAAKMIVSNRWVDSTMPPDNIQVQYDIPYHAVYAKTLSRISTAKDTACRLHCQEKPFTLFTKELQTTLPPLQRLFSSSNTLFDSFLESVRVVVADRQFNLRMILDGILLDNFPTEDAGQSDQDQCALLTEIVHAVHNHFGLVPKLAEHIGDTHQ